MADDLTTLSLDDLRTELGDLDTAIATAIDGPYPILGLHAALQACRVQHEITRRCFDRFTACCQHRGTDQ